MVKYVSWFFSGFYLEFKCVKFEFELESNSNSKFTFSSYLVSKLPSRWTRLISPSYSIQPAQPVHPSGPTKPRNHLTPPLSLLLGACVSAPLSSPTPPGHRAGFAPPVSPHQRARGGGGRTAQPARTPSRRAPVAHPRGGIYRGKDPCAPAGGAPGTVAATEGRPRRRARASSQSRSAGGIHALAPP
jgi:hypothetical protein